MKRAIAAAAVFALLALSGCDDMALRDTIVDLVTRASNTVPEAPSGLSASALSSSSIRLTWTDNSGNETGFKVERSPDGASAWIEVQLTAAAATTWDDSGLSPGTTYYYRVRATNTAGDSSNSSTANATTQAPPFTPPTAPSSLTATAAGVALFIDLTWVDNSSNETGFKIERSSTSSTMGFIEIFVTWAGVTSYNNDTGLSASTQYWYRVRATNSAGDSVYSNVANATTALAAPSGLTSTALSTSSIRVAWSDNSGNETGFKVERSPNGTGDFAQVQLTAAGATTWDDSGLSPGTTYYYRVRATNGGGDSAYSNITSASTLLIIAMITINAAGDYFTMGDGSYGPNKFETISFNYNLSKYEITNAQFAQFIADGGYTTQSYWTTNGWNCKQSQGWTQPYYWTDANFNGANQPVVKVSWYEAVAFCNWRSAKEGLTPAYDSAGHATLSASGYRLPTEVEWEYAAAKGASTETERLWAYSGGTSPPFDQIKVVCNASKTADVGSKSPGGDTPQGLADMSGNVWEWCSDNYQANEDIIVVGPDRYYFLNDSTAQFFIIRGGAWNDPNEDSFRCACRVVYVPSDRGNFGFRVVRP